MHRFLLILFFFLFSYQKTGFYVDLNFSTFTLQRFANVQLYSQKYVPLLGYIIDTDQTSKQENTTNFYICKVYTKYTLYIYRSKTKAELDFFVFFVFPHAKESNCVSPGEQRSGAVKKKKIPPKSSALKSSLGVFSKRQLSSLLQHVRVTNKIERKPLKSPKSCILVSLKPNFSESNFSLFSISPTELKSQLLARFWA